MVSSSISTRRTIWIGLGFLGVSLIWALYFAYVPVRARERFGLSALEVGWLTTLNHLLTLVLLPVFGAWSDRTRTRLGRRLPFVLVGAPLGALLFALIPRVTVAAGVGVFVLLLAGFNLAMAAFRSPLVALMPDLTPSEARSKANALINLMGGLGALLAYFGARALLGMGEEGLYLGGALALLVPCLLVVVRIREPQAQGPAGPGALRELLEGLRELRRPEQLGLRFLLGALLAWFMGFSAIGSFFTSFAKFHLGVPEGTGARILGVFALSFIACAVGAGRLSLRWGRRPVVRWGLALLAAALFGASQARGLGLVTGAMAVAGAAWALVNVNSLPMVLDSVAAERTGAATGIYYLFSTLGGVLSPPLAGRFADRWGYPAMIQLCGAFFALAWLIMAKVQGGEARPPGGLHHA